MDEEMNPAGNAAQLSEPIALLRSFAPGQHAMAVTWDSSDGLPTSVEVRNIRFSNFIEVGAPIPTVSEWGLVVLTLLLLTGAKIYFVCRRTATAS